LTFNTRFHQSCSHLRGPKNLDMFDIELYPSENLLFGRLSAFSTCWYRTINIFVPGQWSENFLGRLATLFVKREVIRPQFLISVLFFKPSNYHEKFLFLMPCTISEPEITPSALHSTMSMRCLH
jgi:hypothetical protein